MNRDFIEQFNNKLSNSIYGINYENDVENLVEYIIENTTTYQIINVGDPFWEKAEMLFLQSIIYYMLEEYKDRPLRMNFTTVLELIRRAKPDNQGKSELDALFDIFEEEHGKDHIAVKQYRLYQKRISTLIMKYIILMNMRGVFYDYR